jgi:hypothetical protein
MTERFPAEGLALPLDLTSGVSGNSEPAITPQELEQMLGLLGITNLPYPAAITPQQSQQMLDIAAEPFTAATAKFKYFQTNPAKPSEYRAPSWSWASSNLCISWINDRKKRDIELRGSEYTVSTTPVMSLLEAHADVEPDEYGTVLASFISVRGPLVEVRRRCAPQADDSIAKHAALNKHLSPLLDNLALGSQDALVQIFETATAVRHAFVRTESGRIFEYFPDDQFEPHPVSKQSEYDCLFNLSGIACNDELCGCKAGWSEQPFWCLRVSRTVIHEESGPTWLIDSWLVLKRSEECDAFERVGMGAFGRVAAEAGQLRLFEDAVETTLTII